MDRDVIEFDVMDIHFGGDVHRIVLNNIKDLPGSTVLEQMRHLETHGDCLRQILLGEPRGGHPALFADLLVRPCDPRAAAGMIIMENNGYPFFSGTNIFSTAMAALLTGRIPMQDGCQEFSLEAPGGLVEIEAENEGGRVKSIACKVLKPAFLYESALSVEVDGYGTVPFSIYWSGEFYPVVDPTCFGFKMEAGEEPALGTFAKAIVEASQLAGIQPKVADIKDSRPIASLIFMAPAMRDDAGNVSRKIIPYVYPNAEVGRCPAGMPSSIAATELFLKGDLAEGETLTTESPSGSTLQVSVLKRSEKRDLHPGAYLKIHGQGHVVAKSTIVVELNDPLTPKTGLETVFEIPVSN